VPVLNPYTVSQLDAPPTVPMYGESWLVRATSLINLHRVVVVVAIQCSRDHSCYFVYLGLNLLDLHHRPCVVTIDRNRRATARASFTRKRYDWYAISRVAQGLQSSPTVTHGGQPGRARSKKNRQDAARNNNYIRLPPFSGFCFSSSPLLER
jgi:hypothetical protein